MKLLNKNNLKYLALVFIVLTFAVVISNLRSIKIYYYEWRYNKSAELGVTKHGYKEVEKLVELGVMPCELAENTEIRRLLENSYLDRIMQSKENLMKYLGKPIITKVCHKGDNYEIWTYYNRYFVFAANGDLVRVAMNMSPWDVECELR